jgi:hypothetical protein
VYDNDYEFDGTEKVLVQFWRDDIAKMAPLLLCLLHTPSAGLLNGLKEHKLQNYMP